jgi:pimeloyl-ACP methyl ester carboxylesterase
MKKALFVLVIIILFSSCGDFLLDENFRGVDWFYLENKGAVMPVWVRGNKQSETFIIFLFGGPGAPSMITPYFKAFNELENHYAFVYYDQRSAGIAQGNASPDSFTVEQFVEDLEKLVTLIRYKYSNPTIFLMGISWGGTLGTAFLVNPENQTHISGWIEINGGHNLKYGIQVHSTEWVIAKAAEQINLGNNVNHWNNEMIWYNSKPDLFSINNVYRHMENLNKLNGYDYDPSNRMEAQFPIASLMFFSPFYPFFQKNNNSLQSIMWRRLENINFVPEMYKITILSLILWGRHDGILPVALGYEAYENIGSANKYLYIFEKSAHNLFNDEPELFVQRVREFVDKHK